MITETVVAGRVFSTDKVDTKVSIDTIEAVTEAVTVAVSPCGPVPVGCAIPSDFAAVGSELPSTATTEYGTRLCRSTITGRRCR